MEKKSKHKLTNSNPALKAFGILVGNWKAVGTHPLVPNTILYGHSEFKWIEGGAFLMWNDKIDYKGFPEGVSIFGSDDATAQYFMLYFDERKVSRKYEVSFQKNVLKWWRNTPEFSQRYTWTIAADGNTIIGNGELSKDGTTWEKDLDLTYTRVK